MTSSTSRSSPPSDCAASAITSASSRSRVAAGRRSHSSSAAPAMPDSGVLISWLIVARNSRCSSSMSLNCVMSRNVHRRPRPSSPSGTWSKLTRRPSRALEGARSARARRASAISRSRAIAALGVGEQPLAGSGTTDVGSWPISSSGARRELQQRARLLVDDRDPAVSASTIRMPSGAPATSASSCAASRRPMSSAARVRVTSRPVISTAIARAAAEAQRRLALDPAPAAVAARAGAARASRCAARPGRRRRARRAATGTSSGWVMRAPQAADQLVLAQAERAPRPTGWRTRSARGRRTSTTRSGESSTSVRDARGRAGLGLGLGDRACRR